ncbi:MAG: hypothetical protein ACXVCY_13265 [Pseudobdellovibrionaceae bacterium]
MCFQVLKILFSLCLVTSVSLANEDAHKESKEAAAAAEGPKNKSGEESYAAIQARVAAIEAKIHSSQAEIQKLIEEKQHTKDAEKVNEIIRQMISLHRQIRENATEYDQQRSLLKYRYPEKGAGEKREYERIEVKSLEDMENQMNLTSSLNHTMKKVRSQYSDGQNEPSHEQGKGMASPSKGESHSVETPGLSDPIILKK